MPPDFLMQNVPGAHSVSDLPAQYYSAPFLFLLAKPSIFPGRNNPYVFVIQSFNPFKKISHTFVKKEKMKKDP